MKIKLSMKNWLICLIIGILAILAIRLDGKPTIYIGLVFAYLAVLLIGLFSNPVVGAISGPVVIGLGFLFRNLYPAATKVTGEKLDAFLLEKSAYTEFYTKYIALLLLFAFLLGLLGGAIGKMLQEDKVEKFSPNRITYMAIFVALGVIINTVRIGSISFGGFPIILSGYLLGPISGFIVGGVTDVVAFIVRPSPFGFNILFTLTSALTGLIPIVVTKLLGEKYPNYSFIKVLIGIIVGQLLTSIILVPIFSTMLFKKVFIVEAGKALVKQALTVPVYAFLITSLINRIGKVVKFDSIK